MLRALVYSRVLFAICPTGLYCREDRCQSYFDLELIPSMRAPLEECEGAAGVHKAGSIAHIIDAPAEALSESDFLGRAAAFNPSLIVLAITFGSLGDDLLWATRLKKEFPHVTIALRGAPCYVWASDILNKAPAVDLCVTGDYELVFEQICLHGNSAPGVTARNERGEIRTAIGHAQPPLATNLDSLPLPNRSTIRQELYTVRGSKHPQATIHVQRGCPFPCTFCLVHSVSGNKARHRSPASIVEEIQQLQREGIRYFYLRAETFTLDRAWAIEVSQALAVHCADARWVTATRVECVDDEVIAAMRLGGCYGISFGVDVASAEIGKRVKKPPRLDLASAAMRLCDRHQILSLAYIMIGFIWDTPDTVAETKRFIRTIRPDLLTVHFAHPYPGTPYYQAVLESGLPVVSLRAQSNPALSTPEISATQFRRYARIMLLQHFIRPRVIISLIRKLLFARSQPPRIRAPLSQPTQAQPSQSQASQSQASQSQASQAAQ